MTDQIRAALERLVATSDVRNHDWHAALTAARTALSAPTLAEGVGELALQLCWMAEAAADGGCSGDAHFLSRAAAVIQNQQAEIQRLKASALAQPAPPAEGEVGEVLQWPTEWSRRQRAQEAEMLCCSAGMTPGKEMQRLVRDARDGMPLQDVHDLISHAIPTPVPAPVPREAGELVEWLRSLEDASIWFETGSPDDRNRARAAELLQQLSAPAPVVVPVPVGERWPEFSDCESTDDRVWCWNRFLDHWKLSRIKQGVHTHWLPAHALPLPKGRSNQGENNV